MEVQTQKIVEPEVKDPNLLCPDLTGQIKLSPEQKHYIAAGGFSYIWKGEWTDPANPERKITVAIKVLRASGYSGTDLEQKLKQRLKRESVLWHSFSHPNVLPFLGLVSDAAFGAVVPALVSPFCERKSVLEYLKNHQDIPRTPLIVGIASGLQYFHNRDAVHGDLKAENVLMSSDGVPLLADFGRSKIIGHTGYTTEFACVWRYLAPEIMDDATSASQGLEDSSKKPITSKSTDVWAFGLVGAEVLASEVVFPKYKQHMHLIMHIIGGGKPQRKDHKLLVESEANVVWPILQECWATKPEERPSMDDVLKKLPSSNASVTQVKGR